MISNSSFEEIRKKADKVRNIELGALLQHFGSTKDYHDKGLVLKMPYYGFMATSSLLLYKKFLQINYIVNQPLMQHPVLYFTLNILPYRRQVQQLIQHGYKILS